MAGAAATLYRARATNLELRHITIARALNP
jgi:hypothetical protein